MAVRLPALCHLDWQERHGAITTTRPLEKKKKALCERRHCAVQTPLKCLRAVR